MTHNAQGCNHNELVRQITSEADSKVGFIELFYDLVFVYAITQVSHTLLKHLNLVGLAQAGFLTLAVWWVWIYTTWATNWLDPQNNRVRLMLVTNMFACLIMGMSIPHAFTDHALRFASAYAFMQVSRSIFTTMAFGSRHPTRMPNLLRISIWLSISGVFWILGGFAHNPERYYFFGIALLIEYVGPIFGFWIPAIGRSYVQDWDISGSHMAERCGLLIIIALDESLLVTGSTYSHLTWTTINFCAFVLAFSSTVIMWWLYFDGGAEKAAEIFAKSDNPGHFGRLVYTYFHIPIIAGLILIAVSDELILTHPTHSVTGMGALAILGGPIIFLFGNLLFKRELLGNYYRGHQLGIATLVVTSFFYSYFSALFLACMATFVMLFIALSDNPESCANRHR